MLCDFSGRQLAIESYNTVFSIPEFVKTWHQDSQTVEKTGRGFKCEVSAS